MLASLRTMTKIAGPGSGSISQRHGSVPKGPGSAARTLLEKKRPSEDYRIRYTKGIIYQGLTQTSCLFEALGAPGEVGGQGPGQQRRPVRRQAAQPGNNALQPRNILC